MNVVWLMPKCILAGSLLWMLPDPQVGWNNTKPMLLLRWFSWRINRLPHQSLLHALRRVPRSCQLKSTVALINCLTPYVGGLFPAADLMVLAELVPTQTRP